MMILTTMTCEKDSTRPWQITVTRRLNDDGIEEYEIHKTQDGKKTHQIITGTRLIVGVATAKEAE